MLNILFSLGYFKKYDITVKSTYGSMESFGFDKGGNFSVNISSESPGIFFIGLATRSEIQKNTGKDFSPEAICTKAKIFSKLHFYFNIVPDETRWNGTIKEEEILKPIVINCLNSELSFSLNVSFWNPKSRLDNRWYLGLKTKIVSLALVAIILILNLFAIVKYSSSSSWFSILMFVASLFTLGSILFSYIELSHNNVSDEHTPFRELRITAHFVSRVLIFSSIILGSNGWGILNNFFDANLVIRGVLLSSFFFSLMSIAENIDLGNWNFLIICFVIVFLVLLTKSIVANITDSEIAIKGQLYIISQNGIDPSSTPAFKKLKKYKLFKNIVIIYLLVTSLESLVAQIFPEIPFWLIDFISETTDTLILFVLSIIFRMTDDTIAGYESIESTNVPLGIIEDIGIDSEIIQNHSLKQWEKGMSLPPLPNIICDELADAENPTNNASIKEENNEEEEEAKTNI